jgi:hypothetical protein
MLSWCLRAFSSTTLYCTSYFFFFFNSCNLFYYTLFSSNIGTCNYHPVQRLNTIAPSMKYLTFFKQILQALQR